MQIRYSKSALALFLGLVAMPILSGTMAHAASNAPETAKDDFSHLQKPVTLSHGQYQAAKSMCLHTVHSNKDNIGDDHAALRLVALCSYGHFDFVMHELGVDVTENLEPVMGENGQELVAEWERNARAAEHHLDIIEAHKNAKEDNAKEAEE